MVTESTETAAETPTELEELRRSGRVVTDDSDAVGGNRYRRVCTALGLGACQPGPGGKIRLKFSQGYTT